MTRRLSQFEQFLVLFKKLKTAAGPRDALPRSTKRALRWATRWRNFRTTSGVVANLKAEYS